MRRIIVLNAKGGSGKSTIATSLAAYYSLWGIKVELADLDPQRSSEGWLKARDRQLSPIRLARVNDLDIKTRPDTEYLIIDAPSGTHGDRLHELLKIADTAVIPVQPSPMDIRAVGHFIFEILTQEGFDKNSIRLGVMANRVKANTVIFRTLNNFLCKLDIPFITFLRDSQNYVKAAEAGIGIMELPSKYIQKDMEQWQPLLAWLNQIPSLPKANIIHDSSDDERVA